MQDDRAAVANAAETAGSSAAPKAIAAYRRPVVRGSVFTILLLMLAIERQIGSSADFNLRAFANFAVETLGWVLLLETLLLACERARPVRRWSRLLGLVAYGGSLLVVLCAHQYFRVTGTPLTLSTLYYALTEVGRALPSVVATAVDYELAVHLAAGALALALLERRGAFRRSAPASLPGPLPIAGLAVAAAALLALTTVFPNSAYTSVHFVRPRSPAQDAPVFPATPIYSAPVLQGHAASSAPNIVLLVLESTGAFSVPPYCETCAGPLPNLARLARESVVYSDFYAVVPHTTKALATTLCGTYPALESRLPETEPGGLRARCMPELLRGLGYRTGFFQTAKGSFENRPALLRNVGFDEWKTAEDMPEGFERFGYFGMDEFAMLQPALDWMRRTPDRPFFATLLTVSTHHPYASAEHQNVRKGEEYEAYLTALKRVDKFIGALLDELGSDPGLANTVLLVMGDHGEAFGEHRRLQHDNVPYEEVLRVPLLAFGPRWLGQPRRVGGLRSQIDILPTTLQLAGAHWTGVLPGISLLDRVGHAAVFSACFGTERCLAMRRGPAAFVFHYGSEPTQVFDVEHDPREQFDIAAQFSRDALRTHEVEMLQTAASAAEQYAH